MQLYHTSGEVDSGNVARIFEADAVEDWSTFCFSDIVQVFVSEYTRDRGPVFNPLELPGIRAVRGADCKSLI